MLSQTVFALIFPVLVYSQFFKVSIVPRCSKGGIPDRLKVILYERDTFTADDELFTVDECKNACTLSTNDNSDFSPNLEFAFKFTGSCVQKDFIRCIAVEGISSRTSGNVLDVKATFDKYSANDVFHGDNFAVSPIRCPNDINRRR